MEEDKFEERRSWPRIHLMCPVLLRGSTREYHGLIRNISARGAAVEIAEELPDRKQYALEFILPDGPEIKVAGVMQWAIPQGEVFLYGIKFTNVGIFDILRLKSYIGKRAKSRPRP